MWGARVALFRCGEIPVFRPVARLRDDFDDLEEAGANIAKTKTIREGRDLTTILSQKS